MEIMVKLKLKKMLVIFQILMILWPTAFALASTVNIGDTLNIERGGLGFYTIQYWSDYRDKWMYITYSRTYYTDQDGNKKIAYCMDQDLDGVGWLPGEYENYDALVREELRNDKIWQVLKHGYPNVSPKDLGVETEDDAYLATKQAVYWIIKHGNEPNAKIENIYTHFRAGETEINNQNFEDIQRRGKKVVDAIYKLVNIAANEQREEIIHPEVIQEDNFIIDKDNNYYSAKYKVTEANVKSKIIIDEIDYANDDIFTADINGNPQKEFLPGETFKVMIPKKSIVEGAEARVDYTIKSELDVLYYVASKIEGKQNYVIFSNRIEEGKSKILLKIPEKQSEIQILKVSSDTGEPMSGVKFQITYEDGRKRICTTNQNGYVHCDHMPSGKVIVEEIETNEGYVLDEKKYEINLGYNEVYMFSVSNHRQKGTISIEKVDQDDNNTKLEGVEFYIIDASGKIIDHVVTDANGKASTTVNTGNYIVRETKTKQEYSIGVDKSVTVNWNETAELKIENEKKKGKIKIIKQDKDDNSVRLAGVKFKILNEEDECIEKLETDENGEALSEDLVIGDYYIKEVETKDSYVLNNKKIKASVKFNETNEITIENEKIKGKIQINKLSEDKNNILETEAGSPIEGVKFNIYDMENKLVDTIVTDKNGVATSKKLEKGRYNVQEIETNKWYILDKKIYEAEIKENNEIVKLDIVNKSKDPKIEIKKSCKNITKSNDEIDYSFEIKNTGNVELEDFTWYDYLPADYAKITGIETGTYNKDILYNIYYKTNQKDEYMVLKKNLNGGEDNFISLTDLHLEKDEKITEIKIYFGNVDVGFKSEKKPHIIMKTNENLENDTKIENSTVLEGYNQDYRVSSKDTAVSTIYNVVQEKKLPRTGF